VTYEDDTLAHVKTEFGFDVLQSGQGAICAFELPRLSSVRGFAPLLDQAFQQVYGVELISVLDDEEKALNSYRKRRQQLIPEANPDRLELDRARQSKRTSRGATHRSFFITFRVGV